MNERIRELAEQAEKFKRDEVSSRERLHNRYLTGDMEEEIFREKFVELIVKECINVLCLRQNPTHYMPDAKNLYIYNQGWIDGRDSGMIDIKKHFGVEK